MQTLEATTDEEPSQPIETFDKGEIAQLTYRTIKGMQEGELAAAVRAAELPLLAGLNARRFIRTDRETLERLVYLARRCCRNQGY